jgi:predicted PurR-regulated permease PerM
VAGQDPEPGDGSRSANARLTWDWRARAEDGWRLLGFGLVAAGIFVIALRLRLVLLPLFGAAIIAVLAMPLARKLGRYVPAGLAALFAVAALLFAALGILAGSVAVVVNDSDRIGEGMSDAADMVAEWIADGPFGLTEQEVEEARADLGDQAGDFARRWAEGGGLLASTVTLLEMLAGSVLALVIALFLVKDHEHLGERALTWWSEAKRPRIRAIAGATVEGLRGYLRGVVILGVVEGVIIGGAVAVLASPAFGLPIAVLTFVAAFFPVVGAIVAGILAIMITLAASGPVPALIVAAVAIVVQQLDNDLLAPVIYGRTVQLHPIGILVALTTGSVLAGVAGAFVAVPLTAMTMAGLRAWREQRDMDREEPTGEAQRAAADADGAERRAQPKARRLPGRPGSRRPS